MTDKVKKKGDTEYIWSGLAGILFVILPLIVLAIVRFYQGSTLWELLRAPDWSFGTAVLFGESVINLLNAAVKSKGNVMCERLGALVAGVVVLGLVPSLVVLSLLLVELTPQTWLIILQITLFAVACFIFLLSIAAESALTSSTV